MCVNHTFACVDRRKSNKFLHFIYFTLCLIPSLYSSLSFSFFSFFFFSLHLHCISIVTHWHYSMTQHQGILVVLLNDPAFKFNWVFTIIYSHFEEYWTSWITTKNNNNNNNNNSSSNCNSSNNNDCKRKLFYSQWQEYENREKKSFQQKQSQ